MARIGSRYRGRHRKPTTTGHTIAKTALAGAVVSAPLVTAGQAQAAPDSVWDRVAQCESGGNWGISTGNGFQGGLQFTQSTWRSFGGTQFASTANRATREQQIVIAEKVLAGQGWNAWPVCSRKAGARGSSATQRTITVKSPAKTHQAPKLSTPAQGDRPARKPTVPTVPSPRRPIEDATPAVPAVLPPAPAVPPAPAPLLAAATQPAPQAPAPALTALPRLQQPAPATGPGVLLAASPPALEHAAPVPAAAPTPAAPLAAAAPPAAPPAAAPAGPLAAAPAPAGPKHAAPEPAAAPAPAPRAAPARPAPAPAHAAPAAPAPAQAAPAPAAPAPGTGRTYQVRPGDTLSGIATSQGVSGGWQAIYESNRGDLHSANLIRPGQQLHLG